MAEKTKKPIPTKTITIGKGVSKKEIDVYTYLTQGEQNKREELIFGENKYSVTSLNTGEIDAYINIETAHKLKEFLVDSLCVDITNEDVNYYEPELREELYRELAKILDNDKKK